MRRRPRFCRQKDVQGEVARFIELLSRGYSDLGFPDYAVALSTHPTSRGVSDELWDWAESRLGARGPPMRVAYSVQPGEGAFYGPKREFALRDR
jgi:threonyl-tRNA synthetase